MPGRRIPGGSKGAGAAGEGTGIVATPGNNAAIGQVRRRRHDKGPGDRRIPPANHIKRSGRRCIGWRHKGWLVPLPSRFRQGVIVMGMAIVMDMGGVRLRLDRRGVLRYRLCLKH